MPKQLLKYLLLFLVGGLCYVLMEIIFRGFSHWSMYILGGVCFILLGLINEILPWETPLWKQMVLGGVIITSLEFIIGYIVNIKMHLGVWDYSALPFNLLGQICLSFSILWCFLSIVGIVLDDYLRYWFFKEEKPKYKLF